jgi:hypothetical protein
LQSNNNNNNKKDPTTLNSFRKEERNQFGVPTPSKGQGKWVIRRYRPILLKFFAQKCRRKVGFWYHDSAQETKTKGKPDSTDYSQMKKKSFGFGTSKQRIDLLCIRSR